MVRDLLVNSKSHSKKLRLVEVDPEKDLGSCELVGHLIPMEASWPVISVNGTGTDHPTWDWVGKAELPCSTL